MKLNELYLLEYGTLDKDLLAVARQIWQLIRSNLGVNFRELMYIRETPILIIVRYEVGDGHWGVFRGDLEGFPIRSMMFRYNAYDAKRLYSTDANAHNDGIYIAEPFDVPLSDEHPQLLVFWVNTEKFKNDMNYTYGVIVHELRHATDPVILKNVRPKVPPESRKYRQDLSHASLIDPESDYTLPYDLQPTELEALFTGAAAIRLPELRELHLDVPHVNAVIANLKPDISNDQEKRLVVYPHIWREYKKFIYNKYNLYNKYSDGLTEDINPYRRIINAIRALLTRMNISIIKYKDDSFKGLGYGPGEGWEKVFELKLEFQNKIYWRCIHFSTTEVFVSKNCLAMARVNNPDLISLGVFIPLADPQLIPKIAEALRESEE